MRRTGVFRVMGNGATGTVSTNNASNDVALDENVRPTGGDEADQSALMAGKLNPRRSVLGAVSGNVVKDATVTISNENSTTSRNLRAKTVKAITTNKPSKSSDGYEDSTSVSASSSSNTLISDADTSTTMVSAAIFPIKKSLLRRIEAVLPQEDKENVAPSQRNIQETVAAAETNEWDDLDAEDAGDPLMVSDYVSEIFDYMRNLEKTVMPRNNYIVQQRELNWHMRSILVDWLIEVQWKLKLLPETLYLSINIIDRFLSLRTVLLPKLQLVGLVATLLASKYEEIVSPSIQNLIFLADNSYTASELLNAERYILQTLNFSLAFPSPMSYLRRISKADCYDIRTRTLAKYLMEVALLDSNFVTCSPSLLSAVGIFTARLILKSGPWHANLTHYSGYSEFEVRRCSNRLIHFFQQEQVYLAVHRKYSTKKYMRASVYVFDWMKRHFPTAPAMKQVYYAHEGSDQ